VLVPPAMTALLDSPTNQVQAFLAAGHVCAIMGWTEYEPIAARYRVPIVVTGFEPLDLLEGIHMAIRQLEEGRAEVENQYTRAVTREGVPLAQRQVMAVFEVGPRKWRGVGEIPMSGYRLRHEYARFDAEQKFDVGDIRTNEHPACIAGAILTGDKVPTDCTAYGTLCSPQKPLGAPMVSSEGTCAAFYSAGRGLAAGGGFSAMPSAGRDGWGGVFDDHFRRPRVIIGADLPGAHPRGPRDPGPRLAAAPARCARSAWRGPLAGRILNDAAIVEVAAHVSRHDRLARRLADLVPGRDIGISR
jgi:hypothetical protein